MIDSISSAEFCNRIFSKLQIEQEGRERRRVARFPWESAVSVTVSEDDGDTQFFPGRSLDISRVGFAILCDVEVQPGAMVHVRVDDLDGQPQVQGRAVSCLPYGESVFRIGVRYTDDPLPLP